MDNRSVVVALALLALLAFGGEAQAQCSGQPGANTVCAGPGSGGAGLPGFRALVPADIPSSYGITVNGTPITGGTSGRIPYNNAGKYGEFVVGGDCVFSAPNFTCTKTNGVNFANPGSAVTDTTNASNIGTGTLATARLNTAVVNDFRAGTAGKVLVADQVFTGEVVINPGATTVIDFSTFINASITLNVNVTTFSFTNIKAGQAGVIRFIQDGTGSRTIPPTINTNLKCAGACNYVLSTAANAVDAIGYTCLSATYCIGGALLKDVK
jgi:hypothetical protein